MIFKGYRLSWEHSFILLKIVELLKWRYSFRFNSIFSRCFRYKSRSITPSRESMHFFSDIKTFWIRRTNGKCTHPNRSAKEIRWSMIRRKRGPRIRTTRYLLRLDRNHRADCALSLPKPFPFNAVKQNCPLKSNVYTKCEWKIIFHFISKNKQKKYVGSPGDGEFGWNNYMRSREY